MVEFNSIYIIFATVTSFDLHLHKNDVVTAVFLKSENYAQRHQRSTQMTGGLVDLQQALGLEPLGSIPGL